MSNGRNIHETLKSFFGYDSFRPGQEEIIRDVLERKDVVALLPTGGGKSLCYQVPALAQDGVCIVVSPLIALMKDQVQQLNKRGIDAVALLSGMSYRDIDRILDNVVFGDIKFLYLSPERLKSEIVRERIKRMNVNLVAIDEAHCVSQWGYDFRPPYLEIAEIRPFINGAPFIALTASATPAVIDDLKGKLQLVNPSVHRKTFFRPNLIFRVEHTEGPEQRILDILSEIPGSAIIYIRSRNQTTNLATRLAAMGVSAVSYHAGLEREERDIRQAQWMAGDIRVMVATNAFGMGIDKPDVRLVIHLELPDGPEAYYQEAGRGGRDGKPAYAYMLLTPNAQQRLVERVKSQLPDLELARRVYTALANHLQIPIGSGEGTFTGLDILGFCKKYDFDHRSAFQALLLLERYGLIRLSEGFKPRSTAQIILPQRELYEFEVTHPRFVPLIRQMLRWYGGITTGPTGIDERALSAAIQLPGVSVAQQLKTLDGMRVVEYRPATSGQGLEWTMARMESNYLPIQRKELVKLEEEAIKRMNAMIYFASHERECRFGVLLSYFGEKPIRCGQCDRCKSEDYVAPDIPIDEAICQVLQKGSLTLIELEQELNAYQVAPIRKALSILLDEGQIKRNTDGRYSSNSR